MRHDPDRRSIPALMKELGLTRAATKRELRRVEALVPCVNGTYDARVVDVINALHGRPHRTLFPAESNWLAAYLEENDDRTDSTAPPPQGSADPDRGA